MRNFARTWAVWLITVFFSAPVVLAMLLIVSAFADNTTSALAGLALAVPIVWPFSALFLRALYGDLTGRVVVAPQDRTAYEAGDSPSRGQSPSAVSEPDQRPTARC